jgi:hypothetical protein
LRATFAGQKFYSRSHDAVICVYDSAGNVIAMHEQEGEVKATISTLPKDKIEKLAASERIAPRETATES